MSQPAKATEKTFPYHVYLLDHELLRFIDYEVYKAGDRVSGYLDPQNPVLGNVEEAREVEGFYRALMSNAPRQDASIKRTYGIQSIGLDEAIENEKQSKEELLALRVRRKAEAALALYQRGYYLKLAEVDAECADDVFALVSGKVLPHWRSERSVDYRVLEASSRNAGSYDLMVRFGQPFMKMSLGYIDLRAGVYATELV